MVRRSINKTLYNNVYSQYKPPNSTGTLRKTSQRALYGVSVYRFVFATNVAFGAALLLCLSLLLQPVAFTYAQEADPQMDANTEAQVDSQPAVTDDESITDQQSSDDLSTLPDTVSDNGDDEADVVESETNDEASKQNEGVTKPSPASSGTTPSNDGASTTDPQVEPDVASTTASSSDSLATASSTDQSASSSDTGTVGAGGSGESSTTTTTTTNTTEQEESTSTQDSVDDDSSSSAVGTSTSSTTPAEPVVHSTVQTDNAFAFNKNECTEVEDGSFYCQKISSDAMADNDLFAAPDATGDMEIYVIQNGEQLKITDNVVDDASPYYDTRSKTIVWHRLVADRYQIISYDVETGEEEQITDTAVNNMEPTRNGDYTVWQRWVQNNWEIILLKDGTESQITDSIEHDIAPHIRGDLIIWNVRSSDGTQSLMTYDIGSEVFNEIKDTDGVSVTNPRMLVMYEAQYQNGDTVMKGFDLVTGEVIPIERIPRELPTDIPSPETTGEVRALPTNPQSEEDISSDTDLDTDEPIENPVEYAEGDLVLTASSTASTTPMVDVAEDFDLDLRPDDTTQATTSNDATIEQAAIPDVVVPEFNQDDGLIQASSTQDV